MSFLPPTGNPPFPSHFPKVTSSQQLKVRGRKCREKTLKKTWEQKRMRRLKRNKTSQTHGHYSETATHSTWLLLDILELKASTPADVGPEDTEPEGTEGGL